MGKKVTKEDTLGVIEAVVEGRATFEKWGPFSDIEIYNWDGFVPNLNDASYVEQLKARMLDRVNFVKSRETVKGGYDKLPEDALQAIVKVVEEANTIK